MTMDGLMITFSSGLFVVLITVLGWIGSRIHLRLDTLGKVLDLKLGEMSTTLITIERDLRKELSGLDRRVSTIEGENHNRRHDNGN